MILAIYDITGIQEYVFSSNKLAENLGASSILENLLPVFFEEQQQTGHCEIVYVGGGNAMVEFATAEHYLETTRTLSRRFVEQTGGMLRFATCGKPISDNSCFETVRKSIMAGLNDQKSCLISSFPLLGISITQDCDSDGWPAVTKEHSSGRWLSYPAARKLQAVPSAQKSKHKNLLDEQSSFSFPNELDQLGKAQGESGHIAVVHIDGNSMGEQIKTILADCSDYSSSKKIMAELSVKIETAFSETLRKLVQKLCQISSNNQGNLPIRPIITTGDDVTFVCRGDLGLWLTEQFLMLLPNELSGDGWKLPLSACAGIAIVKSHFPFYRAYQLAEQLCASAKLKAKSLCPEDPGNWLDFHIVQGGVTTELTPLRHTHYNLKSTQAPNPINHQSGNRGDRLQYPQFNLLWRPWCIRGEFDALYQWKNLVQIIRDFQNWPNSRVKELRNALIGDAHTVDLLLEQFKSRGIKLPVFADYSMSGLFFKDQSGKEWRMTPFFDAIEAREFYSLSSDFSGEASCK